MAQVRTARRGSRREGAKNAGKGAGIDLLRLVIQLVDSRVGPTTDDRDMLRYLRLASIPHIVVATKCDKLNATEKKKCVETLCADPDLSEAECIILYSSQNGAGREELWDEIAAHCNL